MSSRLSGKTAIVTGASKGIGRAISLALAKEGANVVVNYLSNAASANEVVSQIGQDRAIAVGADVSDLAGGKTLIAETMTRFGQIDILVLNAGLMVQNGSLENTIEEDFDRLYKTNVKGPYFLIKVNRPLITDLSRELFDRRYVGSKSPPHRGRESPTLLHFPDRSIRYNTQLPPLRVHKGRRGADDARLGQRPRKARCHGQHHLPWPNWYRWLLRGQDGTAAQDNRVVESE